MQSMPGSPILSFVSMVRAIEPKPAPSARTSEQFCAEDADVTFISSDKVLFHIHKNNLDIAAGGFPPAGFDASGEHVPLTEDAATLELLFQYVYPQRHPHLEDVPFDMLSLVAEAAEKYQVFSAMTICYLRMGHVLPKHALEILEYAFRHGYDNIFDAAAPSLLDIPLNTMVKTISPSLVIPWVCYREAWTQGAFQAITSMQTFNQTKSTQVYCRDCARWIEGCANWESDKLWMRLGERRSKTALESLYLQQPLESPNCDHFSRESFIAKLWRHPTLREIPSFHAFL